ncbi:hypothetical protein [Ruegeria sp. EL01]|uniref:hypothetical protein n=1 Tax=Ruegeria sp. EL01 TaxID=2107578 RepID=UPI000EA80709|nr:hypothetical protein [Ruegeria sp. EL01]
MSPYIEEVNVPLRRAFAQNGTSADVFGTFGEAEEAKVVRISGQSIVSHPRDSRQDWKAGSFQQSKSGMAYEDAE